MCTPIQVQGPRLIPQHTGLPDRCQQEVVWQEVQAPGSHVLLHTMHQTLGAQGLSLLEISETSRSATSPLMHDAMRL